MSIIETIWRWLKKKYFALNPFPITEEESIKALKKLWYEDLKQDYINELILGKLKRDGSREDGMVDRWDALE